MSFNYKNLDIFNSTVISQSESLVFHFISLNNYSVELKSIFDKSIAQILNGIDGDSDIHLAKQEMKKWLNSKKDDPKKQCGYIAEFLCHSYLIDLEFKQKFLFRNLEETKSMKKGFDGLYLFQDEPWIYESKSSLSTTIDATHNSNISEAYNDLKKKVSGKKLDLQGQPVDPWTNAINHASLFQIRPDQTLINNLNRFKKRFLKKDYEQIGNFNIIPSSTIYLENRWQPLESDDLAIKMDKLCKKYEFMKMNVICINKRSINDFIEYING